MKEKIKITEVGPRDGLQNENSFVPTKNKKEYIDFLASAGLKHIEVTSFVKSDRIPQLADSLDLSATLDFGNSSIVYSALTPNLKGYEAAIKSGFKEIAIFGAASEEFTKKNINRTIEESLNSFKELTKEASKDGIKVRGYISTVVSCPYEGKISPEKVLSIVNRMQDMSVYEISLGETIGVAVPSEIENLLNLLLKSFEASYFAGHYHDTYGMAIANVSQSLKMGLRSFDSSSGGLGGCPYARGASGNLATEDIVYFLENSGYDTGVNLDLLIKATSYMEHILTKNLLSKTYLARKKILGL